MPPAVPASKNPLVVAIEMGYGHMRPGAALADALGETLYSCDRPPLADEDETAVWRRARRFYEWATRWSSAPIVGAPLRPVVGSITGIESLHPYRDQSKPTWLVKRMAKSIRAGMGRGLVEVLRETGRPLLSTYFAPAHAADAAGLDGIHLVVTDSDIHRVWAPLDPAASRIHYYVPSTRAKRRLQAYGVEPDHVHVTGYPLPGALLGDDLATLERNLAARIVRLDPTQTFRASCPGELDAFVPGLPDAEEGRAPLVTFAVGGAGAQAGLARQFLPSLRPLIEAGRIRLALVAGVRPEVGATLRAAVTGAGLDARLGDGVEVLLEADLESYFTAFDALLARTDVLWTKPSELTFFGGLGLPLVLSPPVGAHEHYNLRFACESGAGLKQRDARFAGQWLSEWLDDGLLAAAAWAGHARLPSRGLERILERVARG